MSSTKWSAMIEGMQEHALATTGVLSMERALSVRRGLFGGAWRSNFVADHS
jgi:hypothetical protein